MYLIVSKLPEDLLDVQHILPFWTQYAYWFLWIAGSTLVLILTVQLIAKLLKYLQSLNAGKGYETEKPERQFSKGELKRRLKTIHDGTVESKDYRIGLHNISGELKSYFEVLLKRDIEEMTATEIKNALDRRKEVGDFFISMSVLQFRSKKPRKKDFTNTYEKALEIVK